MKKTYLLLYACLYVADCIAQEKPMIISSPGISFVSLEEKQLLAEERGGVRSLKETRANVSLRYAAAIALPGVVHIIATYEPGFTAPGDEAFQNRTKPSLYPTVITGSASGVIITPDGYIVTNCHVARKADSLQVVLADQRAYPARIIGMDSITDIALLKINGQQLPFVHFGSIDSIAVGDWVLAIGSPLGMNSTVTAGIVSAKSRVFTDQEAQGNLSSFIQTDAVMNGGNSGGALVDIAGKLVGINIGILTSTGNFAGYSFAIPVEVVRKVCNDLLRNGYATRASLGVYIANTPGMPGVYVYKLLEDSPAVKGGIQVMDIIKEIDNREVRSIGDIQQTMILHHPGDRIALTILRKGRLVNCEAVLK